MYLWTNKIDRKKTANVLLPAGLITIGCLLVAYFLNPEWNLNYNQIHTVLEIICVAIALTSFYIFWFTANIRKTNLLLGIGFLTVAIFDCFHLLSYPGLGLFPASFLDLPTRYWLVGRFSEALFLIFATTPLNNQIGNKYLTASITLIITVLIGILIYTSPREFFPVLKTATGVTHTKVVIEYIIIFMFSIFLYRAASGKMKDSEMIQQKYIIMAMLVAIPSEICFTLYTTYDYYNILGHLLRVSYYYLLLKAITEGLILYPYKMLETSEMKFSKTFYNNQTIMTISRISDGFYIDINNTFEEVFGYKREEVLGKSAGWLIWAEPNDREILMEELSREREVRNREFKYKRKDGKIGYMTGTASYVDIDNERHVITSWIDITELRKYQREIARLDNLNLMGQMAGSIAHEVRNPMTSIKGFLQLFYQQYKYREDRESIELMVEELDRVNDIITTFLSLSQMNHIELKSMNLNDCIVGVLPLIIADALKNEVFVDNKLEHIPQIMIDKGEIKQLVLNLTRNAIESMPSGGTLTVKTFEDVEGVNLLVQDDGKGIPPEIIDKIGTPFLTTKKDGTGLGMAVCYSIVERHNAKITVDTSSEGTSFKVTFPIPIEREDEVVA